MDFVRRKIQSRISFEKKDSVSNAVPLCLPNNYTWDSVKRKISVDKKKPRKTLKVCEDGLKLLESLGDQLVVVLCIAGPARSGKSFLASLLQEDVTFDVGHGAGSTAGIWIGVGGRPSRFRADDARVVVLDAEGLGGVNTDSSDTDAKWEHKIFSLCMLLSSYVIYNSKGTPNNDELDKLGFIAEFSRSICREKQADVEKQQTPSDFGPDFLWLLRDILCTPALNGEPCDWTKFVKKALLDPKTNEPQRNNIRKSISSTFRTIQAADLPPPTTDSNAVKNLLAAENEGKINQEFFPRVQKVVKQILSSLQVKNIKGSKLTGQQLIDILSHVVDTVNSECDKLDVTNMWNGVVNTQMQRFILSALDLYKDKMEQAELPEEEGKYLKLHESTKDSSKAHFKKVTKRVDKNICSSQLQVLCDKIKIEFHNTLVKKNEQASLSFNQKLMIDLEIQYFNNLPAKPSCMELKTADKKIKDCFNERAKGPKAGQVKNEKQLQRDQKIGSMRTESLMYAEQQSCELFEKSLKEALEEKPLTTSELNALKETYITGCFNNFRKASCDDVDCIHCIKFKQSLRQKVESIFKECSSECYDKSKKACQCLINELIERMLPFVEHIDSHNYSDIRKIKDEILVQYDIRAKGPAKADLMGTYIKTIDMQNEGIQLLIMQSALQSVSCEYTNIWNLTAKFDPCEAEELDKMLALKRREMISAFKVKCEGIDKSKLVPYQLNLEDLIKHFTTLIANENKSRSINLCEDLVTRLSREFHDGILQTHIPEILDETEYIQCSDHLQKAKEFKHEILNDYKQKARGPEKERFQKSLNENIENLLTIVKNMVNEMILKTVLQHHFYQLDTIKLKYPISETELQSTISETNKNTEKEFIGAQKQISLPFVSSSKDILSIILNFDTMQLVGENYKESMRQLDSICKQISLQSRMKCEELVLSGEADTVKFAKIRDDCTQEFEKSGKGALKDHYKSILQGNVDVELRLAHTSIADNKVKRIFADCRISIKNLVQGNPREQDHLEKDIERVKEDARKKIENLQTEASITGTEEMFTIELKETISYVSGKNLNISFGQCSAQLRKVLEPLTSRCKVFLDNEESTVKALCEIKAECLRDYEKGAIGPAKETVKEALERETDKEIQRTYALFAKINYRETLRVQTEAFQFEDQVNTSGVVNLDELTENLEKESQYILLRYPGLVVKISNDLRKDLRKEREFYIKVLKQKITLKTEVAHYRSLIEALIKDGPCEEVHLKKQIDKKRKEAWERIENTFKEVEQANFALTEGMLEKAMEDITRNIETQNYILSTTKCNSLLLQVLKELKCYCHNFLASDTSVIGSLRRLKDEYLRKYDEVAIGPAKAKERNILEKEIDVEIDKTFVLFARAKYREILNRNIEQFQFKDLWNNPEPGNINKLTRFLNTEVQNILKTYPALGRTTKNDLTTELEENINVRLLSALITTYQEKLSQLRLRGILEEVDLRNELDTAKRGLFQIPILLENGKLPEELRKVIENLETCFKQENIERSYKNCQQTLELLFQYNWGYLTKEYFRNTYDKKCKGPARQTVWNENEERIQQHYYWKIAFRRKLSPAKYRFFTEH